MIVAKNNDEPVAPGWCYTLCNLVRRYLFTACRYPALTSAYIRRNIEGPNTSADELQAYIENSTESGRGSALTIVLIFLLYCLKTLYMPYEIFRMLDYDDMESNFKFSAQEAAAASCGNSTSCGHLSDTVGLQFACLATNCSRLSRTEALTINHLRIQDETEVGRLARDMSKLPLFRLCHPLLGTWYSPASSLDSIGLLLFLFASFNAFLLGTWITLQQLLFPAGNEMIMFIAAPSVTSRLARRRAHELLSIMSISYANFCFNNKLRLFAAHPLCSTDEFERHYSYLARLNQLACALTPVRPASARLEPTKYTLPHKKRPVDPHEVKMPNSSAALARAPLRKRRQQHLGVHLVRLRSYAEIERLANECLPIIRSTWWRPNITRTFLWALLGTVSQIVGVIALVQVFIWQQLSKKQVLLSSFAREMHEQDCQIWRLAQEERRPPPIDIEHGNLNWSPLLILEEATFNVLPCLGVSIMFAYYWAIVSELEVWLAELRLHLVATLVVSRCREFGCLPSVSVVNTGNGHHDYAENFYNFARLREQFQRETGFFLGIYFSSIKKCAFGPNGEIVHAKTQTLNTINSRLNDKFRQIQFVELARKRRKPPLCFGQHLGAHLNARTSDHLLTDYEGKQQQQQDGDQNDDILTRDIRTMEQVYVNFRLFIEHVRGLTPTMRVVLTMTYLINYGGVCIAVMCSRNIPDLKAELKFVIILVSLITNALIVLAANFHANAKKLGPLMWSIIAQLTLVQDERLKHLRFLWLQQVQILDAEGGIALKAFGLRVTYINIIQIIIWTLTLIVMALKS